MYRHTTCERIEFQRLRLRGYRAFLLRLLAFCFSPINLLYNALECPIHKFLRDNAALTLKPRVHKPQSLLQRACKLFTRRSSSLCTAAEQGPLPRLVLLVTGRAKLIDVMIPGAIVCGRLGQSLDDMVLLIWCGGMEGKSSGRAPRTRGTRHMLVLTPTSRAFWLSRSCPVSLFSRTVDSLLIENPIAYLDAPGYEIRSRHRLDGYAWLHGPLACS
jgi:hypothetical protein